MLLDFETEVELREHVVFELQLPWWPFTRTELYAEWAREHLTAAIWDERKHPRHPAGSEAGGEFAPKHLAELDRLAAEYDAEIAEREAHREQQRGENVTVDYTPAGVEFEAWAIEMEQWYTEKHGFAPDYWPRERDELWRRYREAVDLEAGPLAARLETAGVPGVTVEPQLSRAAGGDMDVILDPEAELSPDFDVEMPADPAAHETLRPGFSVWTFPDQNDDIIEDIIPLDDRDYFPGGVESETAVRYTKLLDAAAGRPSSISATPVTMYRGMSDAELDAWEAGEEIPAGKFFTSQPTAGYSQDIAGEFPVLQQFRIGQDLLVEVAPGEFQLRTRARMNRGRIEAITSAGGDGVPPINPVVLEAMREMAENKRRAAAGLPPLEKKKKPRRAKQPEPETTPVAPVAPAENLHVVPIRRVNPDRSYGEIVSKVPPEDVGAEITRLEAEHPGESFDWNPDEHPRWPKGQKRFGKIQGGRFRAKSATELRAAAWEETKHPRHPRGSERGGEFAPSTVAPERWTPTLESLQAIVDSVTDPVRKAEVERMVEQHLEARERAAAEAAGTFVRHSDEVLLPTELLNDETDDLLNELSEEIEFEEEDGDPNEIAEGMKEELLRFAEVQDEMRKGLASIEDVHALPASSDRIALQMRQIDNNTWGLHYAERYTPAEAALKEKLVSQYIAINPTKDVGDTRGTMVHEFGHYVDVQVGDGSDWWSNSEEAAGWRDAVFNSDAVKTVQRHRAKDPVYVDYLMSNQELFARSYAQWIALRSGDNTLKGSVMFPGAREGLPERQWEDVDFGPIAVQLDKLMERWIE